MKISYLFIYHFILNSKINSSTIDTSSYIHIISSTTPPTLTNTPPPNSFIYNLSIFRHVYAKYYLLIHLPKGVYQTFAWLRNEADDLQPGSLHFFINHEAWKVVGDDFFYVIVVKCVINISLVLSSYRKFPSCIYTSSWFIIIHHLRTWLFLSSTYFKIFNIIWW